jgi:NTE family protein
MVATGAALTVLTGCRPLGEVNHRGPDAPRAGPLRLAATGRAPVAWVFSSGGPRGFAHAGVVHALTDLGLQPDMVVGASIGALVATLVAGGIKGPPLVDLSLEAGLAQVVRLSLDPRAEGWLSGAGLVPWLDNLLPDADLAALRIPCAVVAVGRDTRQPIAFTQGRAGAAVQAACAIEGQFAPVWIEGQPFCDADLVMPLPVRLARQLGAVRVLAVDASAHEDKAPPGTERWRAGDLRKRELTRPDAQAADVLLHPDFGYYAGYSREWRQHVMATAHRATLAQADRLRALHA